MKILLVFSGNSKDRINIIVHNQAESLRKSGLLVEYFGIDGKGTLSYLTHIIKLRRHLLKHKYDLVHAHFSFSGIVASLAGCKPLTVSLMGSDTKKGFLWNSIIRLFSKNSWDITIVKSLTMRTDIGLKRAEIIPNGVNLNLIKPNPFFQNSNRKIILFASDPVRPSKNFQLAKDALFLLRDDNAELRVIHHRKHEEIIMEINNADLLLVTSLWEGSPNIIKEAMACNCPVVSTNVGDVEWLFGDEPGHFITNFKPEEVANSIKLALDFSKSHGKTKGRDRIIALGLDSETIAHRILQLYNDITENRK